MNLNKKPLPLQTVAPRSCCPVCGKVSYSRTGTHPQCAMARESAMLHAAQKASAVAELKQTV